MAREKSNKWSFTSIIKDEILPLAVKYFKSAIDSQVKSVERTVEKRVSHHLKKFYLSMTMFIGAVILLVGFAVFVENYVSFPKGSGYILIGLIILLTSFIIYALMNNR